MNRKGIWAGLLGILGILMVMSSYIFSPDIPTGIIRNVIRFLFYGGAFSVIISMIMGILGIIAKEKGLLKYTGFFVILLVVVYLVVAQLLIAYSF